MIAPSVRKPFSAKTASKKEITTAIASVSTLTMLDTITLSVDVETWISWRRKSSAKITKKQRPRSVLHSWIKKRLPNLTPTSQPSSKPFQPQLVKPLCSMQWSITSKNWPRTIYTTQRCSSNFCFWKAQLKKRSQTWKCSSGYYLLLNTLKSSETSTSSQSTKRHFLLRSSQLWTVERRMGTNFKNLSSILLEMSICWTNSPSPMK